ncbi:hypothetical protein RQM47_04370 [Rubrivirga sp. S365]|uniref:Lipoprotein n=1 Tax=Rubrivirga litoralis TaxID=3075598 RepID=A0ABU3BM39_9BACT|nr:MULTISPECIES: hypothetical protein [unclassified Rubrivirga]MDT0630357.1 hypothetical protein [Rubrivirga sp. F394]MDT7855868.1 hypothetical protein [Rubrivirga sp. S365]
MSPILPPRPLALVAALALAACSAPPQAEAPAVPEVAGLSSDQVLYLDELGIPVVVPGATGAFRLGGLEVERRAGSVRYALDYRRDDGACFEVSGDTGGMRLPDYPLVSQEAIARGLPGRPTVRVFEAADDPGATSAQVWGVQTVVSEPIALDGVGVLFLSDTADGCRPVSLVEAVEVVSALELLPRVPGGASGGGSAAAGGDTYRPAPDVLDGYNAASTPEAAAEAIARRYETDAVEVEVVEVYDGEAVVLVTAYDLRDDSVRDERLRLLYRDNGVGTWELVDAGRQVRCQARRGHADWGSPPCS